MPYGIELLSANTTFVVFSGLLFESQKAYSRTLGKLFL